MQVQERGAVLPNDLVLDGYFGKLAGEMSRALLAVLVSV
jgi:hypothetical protein